MKGAARFLMGATIGVGLGYTLLLLLAPRSSGAARRRRPPMREPEASREELPVG